MTSAARSVERLPGRGGEPRPRVPDLRRLFATSPDDALREAWRHAGVLIGEDDAGAVARRLVLTAFVYEAGTSGRQRIGEDELVVATLDCVERAVALGLAPAEATNTLRDLE